MENYFIKLWGTPTLRENGRSLPLNEILGKQLTELLCYFLIHRGELVSHDRLIELFWPESVNPQNALKFAVHRLRKLTQPYAETKEQEWIATGKHGYLFSPQAPVETDLYQLSSLTPELLANLLASEAGGRKAVGDRSFYVVLNQVDTKEQAALARQVADILKKIYRISCATSHFEKGERA